MAEHSRDFWSILASTIYRSWFARASFDRPQMRAKRAKTIGNILVHSDYVPQRSKFIFDGPGPKWGSKPCGDCSICKYMTNDEYFQDSSGQVPYKIVHTINCKTEGVVYRNTCQCHMIYIGMTTRELRVRIQEHLRDIRAAVKIDAHNIKCKHFLEKHGGRWQDLRVCGIDRIHLGSRGGHLFKRLEQIECKWFFKLRTYSPYGLNDNISFASFLWLPVGHLPHYFIFFFFVSSFLDSFFCLLCFDWSMGIYDIYFIYLVGFDCC